MTEIQSQILRRRSESDRGSFFPGLQNSSRKANSARAASAKAASEKAASEKAAAISGNNSSSPALVPSGSRSGTAAGNQTPVPSVAQDGTAAADSNAAPAGSNAAPTPSPAPAPAPAADKTSKDGIAAAPGSNSAPTEDAGVVNVNQAPASSQAQAQAPSQAPAPAPTPSQAQAQAPSPAPVPAPAPAADKTSKDGIAAAPGSNSAPTEDAGVVNVNQAPTPSQAPVGDATETSPPDSMALLPPTLQSPPLPQPPLVIHSPDLNATAPAPTPTPINQPLPSNVPPSPTATPLPPPLVIPSNQTRPSPSQQAPAPDTGISLDVPTGNFVIKHVQVKLKTYREIIKDLVEKINTVWSLPQVTSQNAVTSSPKLVDVNTEYRLVVNMVSNNVIIESNEIPDLSTDVDIQNKYKVDFEMVVNYVNLNIRHIYFALKNSAGSDNTATVNNVITRINEVHTFLQTDNGTNNGMPPLEITISDDWKNKIIIAITASQLLGSACDKLLKPLVNSDDLNNNTENNQCSALLQRYLTTNYGLVTGNKYYNYTISIVIHFLISRMLLLMINNNSQQDSYIDMIRRSLESKKDIINPKPAVSPALSPKS